MMADAQKKNCPRKIPIKGSYCAPTICLDKCKKQHGTVGSCAEEKGFCNCAYMPWEGPKNSSDNERKIDSTVSEHTKLWSERTISQPEFWVDLLQCHHQLRVLRLHPHLSPHFPSHEVSFRKDVIIESLVT
ncbi:unnamed protein product [Brassica oleracea]